jgi:hypothetical protein
LAKPIANRDKDLGTNSLSPLLFREVARVKMGMSEFASC